MKKALPILMVLLAACGSGKIGNDDIARAVQAEDAQFKYALPSPRDVQLDAPDSSSQSSGLQASSGLSVICNNPLATDIFCNGEKGVNGINALTAGILGIVDFVRTLPPTVREQNRRVWGPHPDDKHPRRSWKVVVTRARESGALTYRWTIEVRPLPGADFVTIMKGSFVPGPNGTSEGVGELSIDGVAQRSIGDSSDLDLLTIRYDLLSTTRTVVTDAQGRDGAHATFTSDLNPSTGAGGWTYEMPVKISTQDDRLSVRVRWNSQHAGRGDAKLTVPSGSGAGDYFVRECWGSDLTPTYWEQPAFAQCPSSGCVYGDETLCVYADLFSK